MSKAPDFRLVFKHKDNGEYVDLAAIWLGGERDSAKIAAAYGERPGIAAIKLTDGRIVKPVDYWLNVQRPGGAVTKSSAEPPRHHAHDDDDIPF